MTSEKIAELRKLHDGCIAQDLGRLDNDRVVSVPVYRENAAFLIACNNMIGQLLDEREALLKALFEVIYDNRPGGGAEDRARAVIAKVKAP